MLHEEIVKKSSKRIKLKSDYTNDRNIEYRHNKQKGYFENLNGLHEGITLVLECYRDIKKINYHQEKQENHNIENDNVDLPAKLHKPEYNPESFQKLREIGHNSRRLPVANHLRMKLNVKNILTLLSKANDKSYKYSMISITMNFQ